MGTLIMLDGTGPGTGPIAPVVLHPYGRTDAKSRFTADSLGAVGSTVNKWADVISGLDLETPAGVTQTLTVGAGAGGGKSVTQPNTPLTLPQRQWLTRPGAGVKTVVMVVKCPLVSQTSPFFMSGGLWRVQRSGNGTFGLASPTSGGSGTFYTATNTGDWVVLAASVDVATGAGMLKSVGTAAVTGTLTIGTNPSTIDELFSTDLIPMATQVQELITWDKVLTASECEAVMQTLATHYGLTA